jgi:hypothetical protein
LGATAHVVTGLAGWSLLTALSACVALAFRRQSRKLPHLDIVVALVHLLLAIVLFFWRTTLARQVDPHW